MRQSCIAILLAVCAVYGFPRVSSASPPPPLLPPASDFKLTLREDPHSQLPLGPSCGGEAGLTLTCRAFVFTLRNVGKKTVRLNGTNCGEPWFLFERKEPKYPDVWSPFYSSNPPASECKTISYTNIRVRPGRSIQYAVRLRTGTQYEPFIAPGSYTLRAKWDLRGCTEARKGLDCLAPLQIPRTASWGGLTADVDTQTPVEVLSNEIKVESPALPDLGTMKFSFEVTAHRVQPSPDNLNPSAAGCTAETNDSVHCTVFHHTFRYLGSRPIRLGGSCSSPGIWMEYSTDGATWRLGSTLPEKPPIIVPPTHGKPASELTRIRVCGRNVYADKAVFPGVESEGEITLATLLDEYDTTPLSNLAEYQVRFNFLPMACFASPDGSFCLLPPQDQPKVVSNEVTVVATESPSANTPK